MDNNMLGFFVYMNELEEKAKLRSQNEEDASSETEATSDDDGED